MAASAKKATIASSRGAKALNDAHGRMRDGTTANELARLHLRYAPVVLAELGHSQIKTGPLFTQSLMGSADREPTSEWCWSPRPALLSFGPSFQPPLGPILTRRVKMIDAVTAILGLFSAGIFVAHTVDAYRAPKPTAVSPPAPGR